MRRQGRIAQAALENMGQGLVMVDAQGDLVDAVLCAVQAAWAWRRKDDGWGIPQGCDRLEGWIVDPAVLR